METTLLTHFGYSLLYLVKKIPNVITNLQVFY